MMKLVSPEEYVQQAARLIRSASSRVYLLSMVVADHGNTHALIAEIEAAAKRGIRVTVAADVFTFGEVSGGFLPIRYYSPGVKDTRRMVKVLKKAGVDFQWLGRGRATVYNGRTHSKWCIIDDTVFVFGGVNVYQEGIENVDYMFRLTDTALADRLVQEQHRLQNAEKRTTNYPSVAIEHSPDNTVLIDGGIIGQSVIYRRACELAEQAEKITFVSQYCPTGRLARILKRKHDKAKLYYNTPAQAEGLNRFVISLSQFVSGLKTRYKKKTYLHAKFILFTMPDGSKIALTGSHNFAYTGVLLGTREIALETKDPSVITQLESFVREKVR